MTKKEQIIELLDKYGNETELFEAFITKDQFSYLADDLVKLFDINTMTHEEKINYMKIATGIVGYGFDTKGLDMLVSLYELVIEKKGETDLKTVCKVEADVKERADIKIRSELLDKVSDKIG